MDNLDSLLSSVLSDEALMNKIKDTVKGNGGDSSSSLESVISLISPKLKSEGAQNDVEKKADAESEPTNEALGKAGSLSFINTLSHSISKNAGLLIALKPYLSKERCQMIDGVVKISQITDTLKLL